MPYYLDGSAISDNRAFVHGGIQYPANWIRLSTQEDRDAIGMTFVPEARNWDQRFYWGYDPAGNLLPKDHAELVLLWTGKTRDTAGGLLQGSDWMVIRQADNGTTIGDDWRTWRESVRTASNAKITAIAATSTTDELREYILGADYPVWPQDPSQPVVTESDADTVEVGDATAPSAGPVPIDTP